jgi:hypothetical protein
MRINQWLLLILVLAMSCHSPAGKPVPEQPIAADTAKAVSSPGPSPVEDKAFVPKTHLKDTTHAAGSFILFLRPDDARYAELEKEGDEGLGESDADFGAGISGTEDSMKKNDRYKGIRVFSTSSRYICIADCKDGPLTIDRDSVNYGIILSGKGRPVAKTYNSVHSGDYLGELDDYFSLR